MNSFLTCLVRGDHSLQLAAHLAAGILSLLLLAGAARPATGKMLGAVGFDRPTLVVATASGGR